MRQEPEGTRSRCSSTSRSPRPTRGSRASWSSRRASRTGSRSSRPRRARPSSPYYRINPSGRVPYLVDDAGVGMEDSQLICAYLDGLDGKPRFHPARIPIGPTAGSRPRRAACSTASRCGRARWAGPRTSARPPRSRTRRRAPSAWRTISRRGGASPACRARRTWRSWCLAVAIETRAQARARRPHRRPAASSPPGSPAHATCPRMRATAPPTHGRASRLTRDLTPPPPPSRPAPPWRRRT